MKINKQTKAKSRLKLPKLSKPKLTDKPKVISSADQGGGKKKYSYIKKAFAVNGFYAMGVAAVSLLLFSAAMYRSVSTAGNGGLSLGALGISSLLMAFMSLRFAWLSGKEENRNYIFSFISAGVCALMILAWTALIVIGLRI